MLADVAHEEHTHVVSFRQSEQPCSLAIGLEPCFIADHDRVLKPALLLCIAQEVLDGCRLGKSLVSQHPCRRRRWRDSEDSAPSFAQSALHFPERRRFSGSSHAPKTEYSISCTENRDNDLLLFLGEMRSWNKAEFSARQVFLVSLTYFTARCSSRKPCRVQHSESSWFSSESVRRTSPDSPCELLDLPFNLLTTLGEALANRIGYSFNLKAGNLPILPHQSDAIAELLNHARHLVLVHLARVADRADHLVFVKSIPFTGVVAGGVRDHKVRVELRVECSAGIMGKGRRADVTRDFRLTLKKGIPLA